MNLITQETLNKLIQGGESITKVAAGTATELTNEAINLFIVSSLLAVLKFSVVFIIFFIVKKYCDTMTAAAEKEQQSLFKAFKTTALVLSLVFFTYKSFPCITDVAKALVAPKIFLMEKTAEFTKNTTNDK
jgi:hypothetical protein